MHVYFLQCPTVGCEINEEHYGKPVIKRQKAIQVRLQIEEKTFRNQIDEEVAKEDAQIAEGGRVIKNLEENYAGLTKQKIFCKQKIMRINELMQDCETRMQNAKKSNAKRLKKLKYLDICRQGLVSIDENDKTSAIINISSDDEDNTAPSHKKQRVILKIEPKNL